MNNFPADINWSLVKLSMDKTNLFFGCLTDVGDVLGPGQVRRQGDSKVLDGWTGGDDVTFNLEFGGNRSTRT